MLERFERLLVLFQGFLEFLGVGQRFLKAFLDLPFQIGSEDRFREGAGNQDGDHDARSLLGVILALDGCHYGRFDPEVDGFPDQIGHSGRFDPQQGRGQTGVGGIKAAVGE